MLLKVHWVMTVQIVFSLMAFSDQECTDVNGISDDEIPKYRGPYNRACKSQKMPSTSSRRTTHSMSESIDMAECREDNGMEHKSQNPVDL